MLNLGVHTQAGIHLIGQIWEMHFEEWQKAFSENSDFKKETEVNCGTELNRYLTRTANIEKQWSCIYKQTIGKLLT